MALTSGALGPARRRVLADDVTDSLRLAIVSHELEPGQRMREDELATEMKVSRGPVREALVRLEGEGLVVLERHRGARVASLSLEDIEQIYGLRRVLERLAVEWACKKATDEDFGRMEAPLQEFGALTKKKRTPAMAAELDIRFHDALFLAAHNARLYRAWEGLRSQIYSFLHTRMALRQDYQDLWVPDHRNLLELVRHGQRAEGVKAISQHVDRAYRRLVSALAEDGPGGQSGTGS